MNPIKLLGGSKRKRKRKRERRKRKEEAKKAAKAKRLRRRWNCVNRLILEESRASQKLKPEVTTRGRKEVAVRDFTREGRIEVAVRDFIHNIPFYKDHERYPLLKLVSYLDLMILWHLHNMC